MKNTFLWIKYFFLLLLFACLGVFFLFFSGPFASAHNVLPDEIMQYITEHPKATDQEVEDFFQKTFGYPIDEFWTKNQDPADALFEPSQEYIDMNLAEKKKLSEVDIATEKLSRKLLQNSEGFEKIPLSSQELFLQRSLALKVSEKKSFSDILKSYIPVGILHILEGMDHIFFVLSLLLLGLSFRRLLLLLTVFTVAHSLTLLLAGMNIITVSSRIVEPIISFSIVFTILLALFTNQNLCSSCSLYLRKYIPEGIRGIITKFSFHILIVFLFALFHGLGFAGSFSVLNISSQDYFFPLLALNIGVEIGQVCILSFGMLTFLLLNRSKEGQNLLCLLSIIFLTVALFWTGERIFL